MMMMMMIMIVMRMMSNTLSSNIRNGKEGAVQELAAQLRKVFKHTGFFMLSNHGCEKEIETTMEASRRVHTLLSQEQKEEMAFGSRGVGYLRINSRLLPKREKGNMNEAFILKQEPGTLPLTQTLFLKSLTCLDSKIRYYVMQQPWSLSLSPCFQCLQQRSTSRRTSSRKLLSRPCSASVCLTIHLLLNTRTSTASLPIRTPVFSPCWLRTRKAS